MAKINSTKKLIIEDYPADVRPWLKKMIDPLNRFLEQVYYALVKGLTVSDNLKAQINTVSVAVGQTYPIKFAWTLNERPSAVWVANCSEDSGGTVAAYSIAWVYNNGQIEVTLTGLDNAKAYTFKIIGLV